MRVQRPALACVVGLMILAVLAPSARAHFRSHGDPRDMEGLGTPGNRARIDIERVRLRIEDGDVVVKIATYGRLAAWGEVRAFFDSRGGPRMDRYAYAAWDDASGGWLERGVYRRGGDRVDDLRARKRGGVLRLRFPRSALHPTRHLRWRVSAAVPSPDATFVDRAPDAGWYEH